MIKFNFIRHMTERSRRANLGNVRYSLIERSMIGSYLDNTRHPVREYYPKLTFDNQLNTHNQPQGG